MIWGYQSFPPPLHQSSPGALEIATPRDADAQLAELPELAELRAAAVGLVGEQSMSIDLALARCETLALEVLGFAEKNVFHSFPNGIPMGNPRLGESMMGRCFIFWWFRTQIHEYGGFHKWEPPIAGWFYIGKSGKQKWIIWGYPHFRKPPYLDVGSGFGITTHHNPPPKK